VGIENCRRDEEGGCEGIHKEGETQAPPLRAKNSRTQRAETYNRRSHIWYRDGEMIKVLGCGGANQNKLPRNAKPRVAKKKKQRPSEAKRQYLRLYCHNEMVKKKYIIDSRQSSNENCATTINAWRHNYTSTKANMGGRGGLQGGKLSRPSVNREGGTTKP